MEVGKDLSLVFVPKDLSALICYAVLAMALAGCVPIYTTKDLAALPCEPALFYFHPVEFDLKGDLAYSDQLDDLQRRLSDTQVEDVFIFVHGWDKPSIVAEQDYQNFICRLYDRGVPDTKLPKPPTYIPQFRNAVIVGLFWRSSVFPNSGDPDILKFITYYEIRNRADSVAYMGMQRFLWAVIKAMEQRGGDAKLNLHFIGHSFGSRVIVRSLYRHFSYYQDEAQKFIAGFNRMNLVLLLGALSEDYLKRPDKFVKETQKERFRKTRKMFDKMQEPGGLENLSLDEMSRLSYELYNQVGEPDFLPELEKATSKIRIFNIYSQNDYANRFLFPTASIFTADDSVGCALGGCEASDYPTIEVDTAGHPIFPKVKGSDNIWNVNASPIIFSHGDIYKGRVANLIWELLAWQTN